MRNIEFRLTYLGKIIGYERHEYNKENDHITIFHNEYNIAAVEDAELQHDNKDQFTGLKDKNDKEIYEGDIVKWFGWGMRAGKQIRPERTMIVGDANGEYGKESWIADLHKLWCIHTGNSQGTVEVIGNVYENPELIMPTG
ncbi:hypothetical protein LCGC14_1723510 [marine sediment metagenome]|uniref:YopX protein domain-containing protein n=1 Tax=marine sediment metagenome TaxID=412755 RepID=A0A0F9HBS4_9ZZZZ